MTAAQQAIAANMTEAELQANVIELAHVYSWLVHHTRPAQRQSGRWSTPIQGDPGFPDLVLARRELLLFVELKSRRGTRTMAQIRWADALRPHYRLWRPADWLSGDIRRTLEVA